MEGIEISLKTELKAKLISKVITLNQSISERLSLMSVKEEDDHFVLVICGGDNGTNDWVKYMDQIKSLIIGLDAYIIDLVNDCPDDVWYLQLGVRK